MLSRKIAPKGRQELEGCKLGAKQRMLAALEIYNKPIFPCREEIYTILAVSAWEFLFKAKLIKEKGPEALKLDTSSMKNKESNKVLGELRKIGVIEKNVDSNLKALKPIRNSCCHGNLTNDYIEKISGLSLACFHNFVKAYKEWFDADLLGEGFGISPIFYHLPDVEQHKEIPVHLKEITESVDKSWSSDPGDGPSKYQVFTQVKIEIASGTSSKSDKLLSVTWDPNNPHARPVKEDLSMFERDYNKRYDDINKKIKELNKGKPVSQETRGKIHNELKENSECSTPRRMNPQKPADKKGNLTYFYNMSECVKVIKKHLSYERS